MKTGVISCLQNIFCICSKPLHSRFLAKQVTCRLLQAWGAFSPPRCCLDRDAQSYLGTRRRQGSPDLYGRG